MGFTDFLKKLASPKYREENPILRKKMPEEIELESYLEQERRDRVRYLLHQKRKEHNQFIKYKPRYDFNEGTFKYFKDQPKKQVHEIKTRKTNNNLFFKN